MGYQVRETGDGFAVCCVFGNRIVHVVAIRATRDDAEAKARDMTAFHELIAQAFAPNACSKA